MNKSSFNFDKKRLILSSVAAACALAMPRGGLRSMVSAAAALGLGSALLKPSANEASIDANERQRPSLFVQPSSMASLCGGRSTVIPTQVQYPSSWYMVFLLIHVCGVM